jgi:hypothetical protein
MQITDVFWCTVWQNQARTVTLVPRRIPAKRRGLALHAPARLVSVGGYTHADRDVREGEAQLFHLLGKNDRPRR